MTSEDGGRQWRAAGWGGQSEPVDTVAADPHVAGPRVGGTRGSGLRQR